MPDNHLLTDKTAGASSEPSQEAQLRQALELMGGRKAGPANSKPAQSAGRVAGGNPATRHRYVRDGEVPVVHAALGRQGRPMDPSTSYDKAVLETLRQELDRERSARESAERQLVEARTSLTALQTRLAHVEMDLQAAHEQAAAQGISESTQAAGEMQPAPEPRRRPRAARPRREIEPEPVKWWIRTEKS